MSNVRKRVLLTSVPILLALAVFSPAIYVLLWHLHHGSVVAFKGKKVQVPPGWIASSREPRVLSLTRIPILVFNLDQLTSTFGLGPMPADHSQNSQEAYKSWESVNWMLWNKTQGEVKGPFRV